MLSIQQLASIAACYFTSMADAMIGACVAKAQETGESLRLPERKPRARKSKVRVTSEDADEIDWEKMVEANSDTRLHHM